MKKKRELEIYKKINLSDPVSNRKAYLFPGQGSQQVGMGKALYHANAQARAVFKLANEVLHMDLTTMILEGEQEALKQTTVAQPAIFVCSVVMAMLSDNFHPAAVAGHSLGEISALAASGVITFEDGLQLVAIRSRAMEKACKLFPGSMLAVLGLTDQVVTEVCAQITSTVVVAANYNCPGQVVISGSQQGITLAGEALQQAGARHMIPLKVAGAFHSPLMESAQETFAQGLTSIPFSKGICPVYQNVTGTPTTDPAIIKQQLQLTSPIYWTKTIQHMVADGIDTFIECGPGNVLQGLNKKIVPTYPISSLTCVLD